MKPRRLAILIAGLAAVAAAGVVVAQEPISPPPPPGYVPGGGAAPFTPTEGAPTQPAGPGPVVSLGGSAPPPEEAAPPARIADEANAQAEPLPSPDAKKTEPMKRPRFASAILQAVDKTTAETLRFEAKVGEPVRYKGMVITIHACEATASDEGLGDSIAHLDIQAQPEAITRQAARVVFRGWMFSASPGLHAVEHPLYDVWLIACKTAAPGAPGVNL